MQYTAGGFKKTTDGDDDHRYRIKVYLLADNRPRYWTYHCAYCGMKVCELSGTIVMTNDLGDIMIDASHPHINVACKQRSCKGIWYEFVLK